MARAQKHKRPRERNNECARDIDSRSSSRCKVVEDRARDRGANDSQSEVQQDTPARTPEDPEGRVTGRESEKDEDND